MDGSLFWAHGEIKVDGAFRCGKMGGGRVDCLAVKCKVLNLEGEILRSLRAHTLRCWGSDSSGCQSESGDELHFDKIRVSKVFNKGSRRYDFISVIISKVFGW